jgi:replicative DNA helicase
MVGVSAPNVIEDLIDLKLYNLKLSLSAAFASGADDKIASLLEKYNKYKTGELVNVTQTLDVIKAPDIADILSRTSSSNRIKLLPTVVNNMLGGGALRGHHIIVFGRPEVGKSLFTLNMVYGFLQQKLRVLYVGNEDPMADLTLRLLIRVTGMHKEEIRANPDKAKALAKERGYDEFIFASLTPGTLDEIHGLMEDHKPDVIVLDQLRNVNINDSNKVTQLEKAALGVRMHGKKYNSLVVSVVQAGDSAQGKLYLDMGDVDFSNTGIPAQADLMIGIGMNSDYERSGMRMLSFPKNKISGIKETIRVKFDPTMTRVE